MSIRTILPDCQLLEGHQDMVGTSALRRYSPPCFIWSKSSRRSGAVLGVVICQNVVTPAVSILWVNGVEAPTLYPTSLIFPPLGVVKSTLRGLVTSFGCT